MERLMSRCFRRILMTGTLVSLAAGCTGEPVAPLGTDIELEATLEQLAAEANTAGDVDAAAAFGDGLLAVRLGVRPSELDVTVDGETSTYRAIVTGVAHARGDVVLLRRSLIAWTGDRPRAVLQVTSMSDEAAFGYPADVVTREDPVGRARGTWVHLGRRQTFVATSGSAAQALASTGDPCPNLPDDARLRCVVARYDVAVSGVFHLLPQRDARQADLRTRVEIRTAGGVAGVMVSRIAER
jgi:hypothetical protein